MIFFFSFFYLPNQVLCALREVGGEGELATADGDESLLLGFARKRRKPGEQLVAQDTTAPNVDLLVVRLVPDHLWREVVQRSAQRHPPCIQKAETKKKKEGQSECCTRTMSTYLAQD
jgi:hypothetical protein